MNLTIGEQQLELASGGAVAATSSSADGVRWIFLAALDDAQALTSHFFEFAQVNTAALFVYLERSAYAKSVGEFAELTNMYVQEQFDVMSGYANRLVRPERKTSPVGRP